MSASMSDLEKEIEESRARLDRTIDRIQDRLTPVNLVDEMLGSARRTPLMSEVYDSALESVRRNPLPVLMIVAGVGMLLGKIGRGKIGRGKAGDAAPVAAGHRRVPAPSQAAPTPAPGLPPERAYDPDQPGGRPARDLGNETKA